MNEYLTHGSGLPHTNRMPDTTETPPIIIGDDDDERFNAGPRDERRSTREERISDAERERIERLIRTEDNESRGRSRVPIDATGNPEDIIEYLKNNNEEESGRQTSSAEVVQELERRLLGTDKIEYAQKLVENLSGFAKALEAELKKPKKTEPTDEEKAKIAEAGELLKEYEALAKSKDLWDIKDKAKELFKKLHAGLKPFEGKGNPQEYVHSLEELSDIIMSQSGDEWKPGGEFQLVDKEGKFHPENFHAWIRSRIWFYDDFSPDTDINLFQDIAIPTVYKNITFDEMYKTDRYFAKRKVTEAGDINFESDATYNELKDQLLWEVWLANENHNNDSRYRLVSGIPDEQKKAMQQMNHYNIFTRTQDRWLRMLRLPSIDQLESYDEKNNTAYSNFVDNKVQGSVGKAHQRSILAYMYLPDREMFHKVFTVKGDTSGLDAFYRSSVEQAFKEKTMVVKEKKWRRENPGKEPSEKEIDDTKIDIFGNGEDRENFFEELNKYTEYKKTKNERAEDYYRRAINISRSDFDNFLLTSASKEQFALKAMAYRFGNDDIDRDNPKQNAREDPLYKSWDKVKAPGEDATNGMYDAFNIYSNIRLPEDRIELVRKSIRAALDKIEENEQIKKGDFNDPARKKIYDKRRELDVKFAEMWGFRESSWTGIAVYNDTRAIAHDKWGQPINTSNYRQRQAQGRGASGIEDTILGLKRLSLNLWQGLKVRQEGGRAFDKMFLEVIQGGQGDSINLDDDIEAFDFDGNAQRQWYNDHVDKSWKITDFLIDKDGMNLNNYLKYDYRGKLVIDYPKFQAEVMDFLWHDMRYFIDQAGLLWNNKIRSWETVDGKLVFGATELKKHMFSDKVLEMNMYERGHLNENDPEYSKRQAEEVKNGAFARNVMGYLIAKEIKWHMKDRPGAIKWGLHEVETINKLLSEWDYEKHFDSNTEEVIKRIPFFSEEELERIDEMGDADVKKLKINLILYLLGLFFASTIWGSIKESRKIVTDVAGGGK